MDELKTLVMRALEKNGTLSSIRAELRANVYKAIDGGGPDKGGGEYAAAAVGNNRAGPPPSNKLSESPMGPVIAELVFEFLEFYGLWHTLSVFGPDSGKDRRSPRNRGELADEIGLLRPPQAGSTLLEQLVSQGLEARGGGSSTVSSTPPPLLTGSSSPPKGAEENKDGGAEDKPKETPFAFAFKPEERGPGGAGAQEKGSGEEKKGTPAMEEVILHDSDEEQDSKKPEVTPASSLKQKEKPSSSMGGGLGGSLLPPLTSSLPPLGGKLGGNLPPLTSTAGGRGAFGEKSPGKKKTADSPEKEKKSKKNKFGFESPSDVSASFEEESLEESSLDKSGNSDIRRLRDIDKKIAELTKSEKKERKDDGAAGGSAAAEGEKKQSLEEGEVKEAVEEWAEESGVKKGPDVRRLSEPVKDALDEWQAGLEKAAPGKAAKKHSPKGAEAAGRKRSGGAGEEKEKGKGKLDGFGFRSEESAEDVASEIATSMSGDFSVGDDEEDALADSGLGSLGGSKAEPHTVSTGWKKRGLGGADLGASASIMDSSIGGPDASVDSIELDKLDFVEDVMR